jgi:hypothetical protein
MLNKKTIGIRERGHFRVSLHEIVKIGVPHRQSSRSK